MLDVPCLIFIQLLLPYKKNFSQNSAQKFISDKQIDFLFDLGLFSSELAWSRTFSIDHKFKGSSFLKF